MSQTAERALSEMGMADRGLRLALKGKAELSRAESDGVLACKRCPVERVYSARRLGHFLPGELTHKEATAPSFNGSILPDALTQNHSSDSL